MVGGAAVAIFVYPTDGVMVTYDALCHSTRLDQILSGAILPTKDESTVYIDSQRYSCGSTAVNSPVGYWQESLPYALSENRIVTIIAVNGVVCTGLCALGMWLSGKWKWLLMAVRSMPVTLLSIAWTSPDAMSISMTAIMPGCMLSLLDSGSWARKHINAMTAVMVTTALVLGQSKSSLCAIAVLPLLLPLLLRRKTFGWWRAVAVFITQAVSTTTWMILSRAVTPVYCGLRESCAFFDSGR